MSQFVTTSGVLLETSCGAFTVDLYGADAPIHTADFINLCRCKAWNGAVVTSVIPDVAVVFSHVSCHGYPEMLETELLDANADTTPTAGSAGLFWVMACASTSTSSPTVKAEITAQARTLTAAASLDESQRCKRQSVTALSPTGPAKHSRPAAATGDGAGRSVGSLGRKGLLLVPIKAAQTGISTSSSTATPFASQLRFALTLADRNMDFLETEWMAIGEVTEGLSGVLPRLRAAVSATTATTATSPADAQRHGASSSSTWPRPIRMVRLKHSTALSTVGTEKYLGTRSAPPPPPQGSAAAAKALSASGCFAHWASPGAVSAANRTLVRVLRRYTASCGVATSETDHHDHNQNPATHRSLVRVPGHARDDSDAIVSVEYEPHFTAEYLSSDEELAAELEEQYQPQRGAWEPAGRIGRVRTAASSKAQEQRREAARQLHEEKANETLSLMLNVLNGITDTSGDIRPPENVLFVCKLNPATTGAGLAMVFAQFGKVISADVIMDLKTKQSLCYGFVEFESVEACYRAFTRMDKALVDDCRIHVDFSQSVSKLWAQRQRQQRKRERGD